MKKPVHSHPHKATPPPVPTCGTCIYGIAEAGNTWCHRYPPVVVLKDKPPTETEPGIKDCPHTFYPVVGKDKPGCGEHRRGK